MGSDIWPPVEADGSVVSWGPKLYGGDSQAVQGELRQVRTIRASGAAFAALRAVAGQRKAKTWPVSKVGLVLSESGPVCPVSCLTCLATLRKADLWILSWSLSSQRFQVRS